MIEIVVKFVALAAATWLAVWAVQLTWSGVRRHLRVRKHCRQCFAGAMAAAAEAETGRADTAGHLRYAVSGEPVDWAEADLPRADGPDGLCSDCREALTG